MKKYYSPLIALFVCFTSLNAVQAQTKEVPTIKISGELTKPATFQMNDLQKMPRTRVMRKDRDGNAHEYDGVLLSDLLTKTGTTIGKDLKGKNLTKFALIEAGDGYQVIFALAELDPDFNDEKIILADQMDGKMLPAADGPFRIVVENEKKPARCIKQVRSIKIGFSK